MSINLMHPSAALRICVNAIEHGQLQGEVYSQRLTAPLSFSDLTQLILLLDHLLDVQNFPQAFQRARTFQRKTNHSVPAASRPEDGMPPEVVESASGAVGTFALFVLSRRDATWQGVVDWMDGSQREEFSTLLHLIHLIDDRFSA